MSLLQTDFVELNDELEIDIIDQHKPVLSWWKRRDERPALFDTRPQSN